MVISHWWSGDNCLSLHRSPRKRQNASEQRSTPVKKALLMVEEKEEEEEEELIERDWTDRFTGLWQSQPEDFVREQAFNKLMSLGGSHCCICSLFESPSPFAAFSHLRLESMVRSLKAAEQSPSRQSKSLKVVVQRAMVQLPPSLQGRLWQEEKEEEGSQLLTCSVCNITVHKCECLCVCVCVCVCVCGYVCICVCVY